MKLRLLGNLSGLLLFAFALLPVTLVHESDSAGLVPTSMTAESAMSQACESVQVAAHRGFGPGTRWIARVQYTEDTTKSANGAFYFGADVVKADLHMSAAGTWFILHDSDLTRVTNGHDHWRLRAMSDEQIRKVVLPDGSHIPSLQEYLINLRGGRYANRMLQLEVKRQAHTHADMQRAIDEIRAYSLQNQVMLISSTNSMINEMWNIAPEISRTYVWYPNGSRPAFSQVSRHAQMINVDQSQATVRWVRTAHRHGFNVAVRSANKSKQWYGLLHRAARARPDQISTDKIPAYSRWCSRR